MDDFRIGWDLIENWDHYQCFGLGRAAILQFSRGCPHPCTFCGQRDFWVEWRHRDPVRLVDEIEWLYRTHNIRFLSLGDENPSTNKVIWKQFLEEMAARKIPVYFFTSIRASDIVRDADILHLYKKAGILYVLIGIESTEPEVLELIKKGSSTRLDLQALRLFRKHGIFSIVAHVVGWKEESWKTFITAIKQLIYYDGDFVNVTHVTPHSWTEFARESKNRSIIENDLSKWDYRHQILAQQNLSPWQVFLAVKVLETIVHARPSKLIRLLRTKDPFLRKQLFWSFFHTTLLWLGETLVWVWEKIRPKKQPIYEVEPTSTSYTLKSFPNTELPNVK
jgi:anaerobic magnesium-protoporphyrin IX monomethyl ester cyclase